MKTRFKIQLVAIVAAMFIGLSAMAQTYTTFGIGTDYPVGTLHIHSGDVYSNQVLPVVGPPPGITPNNPNGMLNLNQLNSGGEFEYDYVTIFHITNDNTGEDEDNGFSIIQSNRDIIMRQFEDHGYFRIDNNVGSLTLTPTGNIGIGDTAANYRLNVAGNTQITGNLHIGTNLTMGGNASTQNLTVGHTLNSSVASITSLTVPSYFHVTGTAVFENDVSIGDGFYCDDEGNLKVRKLEVTTLNWPDYVFSEGHPMMTLPETEHYIKRHGHLPDIPSAAEAEQNGVDLGEMNRLLLQKVEELTLYAIDLQKQIDELKTKINED